MPQHEYENGRVYTGKEYTEFSGAEQIQRVAIDYTSSGYIYWDIFFTPTPMDGDELRHRIFLMPERPTTATSKKKGSTYWLLAQVFDAAQVTYGIRGHCPKCNHNFVIDRLSVQMNDERVECPECKHVFGYAKLKGPIVYKFDDEQLIGKPVYIFVGKSYDNYLRIYGFAQAGASEELLDEARKRARAQQRRDHEYAKRQGVRSSNASTGGKTDDDLPF